MKLEAGSTARECTPGRNCVLRLELEAIEADFFARLRSNCRALPPRFAGTFESVLDSERGETVVVCSSGMIPDGMLRFGCRDHE